LQINIKQKEILKNTFYKSKYMYCSCHNTFMHLNILQYFIYHSCCIRLELEPVESEQELPEVPAQVEDVTNHFAEQGMPWFIPQTFLYFGFAK
jgi:hypothetical protein